MEPYAGAFAQSLRGSLKTGNSPIRFDFAERRAGRLSFPYGGAQEGRKSPGSSLLPGHATTVSKRGPGAAKPELEPRARRMGPECAPIYFLQDRIGACAPAGGFAISLSRAC